jgi:hypothetical protein
MSSNNKRKSWLSSFKPLQAKINKSRNKKIIDSEPDHFWVKFPSLKLNEKGEVKPDFSREHSIYSFDNNVNAGGSYLDYSKLSSYSLQRLKSDIKKLWTVRRKYLTNNEVDKAKWWFKSKIKPVLEAIEKKESK